MGKPTQEELADFHENVEGRSDQATEWAAEVATERALELGRACLDAGITEAEGIVRLVRAVKAFTCGLSVGPIQIEKARDALRSCGIEPDPTDKEADR